MRIRFLILPAALLALNLAGCADRQSEAPNMAVERFIRMLRKAAENKKRPAALGEWAGRACGPGAANAPGRRIDSGAGFGYTGNRKRANSGKR